MYNAKNLEVRKIVKKSGAPEYAGVCFMPDRTIASDTVRLLEITVPKKKVAAVGKPLKELFKHALTGKDQILVPGKVLAKIKIRGKDDEIFFTRSEKEEARISQIQDETVTHHEFKPIQKLFPDYKSRIPTKAPLVSVDVNAKALASILGILSKFSTDSRVSLRIFGPGEPIVVLTENEDQKGMGAVMPLAAVAPKKD